MDYVKFWEWLKRLPPFMKILVIVALACILGVATFTSCGTPKTVATVQNVNPNSTVTVTMSVSNTNTSTPSVDVDNSVVPSYE